jgi:hypothetical protein
MKSLSRLSQACAGALLLALAGAPVFAEEPTSTSALTAASAPADNSRMYDRDGKRIPGYELMTETEINGYRALMFSIKDPQAREQARQEHRKAMEKRAAERGVKLQD